MAEISNKWKVTQAKIHSLVGFAFIIIAIWAVLYASVNPIKGGWWARLNKPLWLPSSETLDSIWWILYTFIGFSGWLVWNKLKGLSFEKKIFNSVMIPYWSQLLIDFSWSILFFGLHQPVLAAIDICILWWLIIGNIIAFARVEKAAALLLIPYLVWVTYAASLSIAIAYIN